VDFEDERGLGGLWKEIVDTIETLSAAGCYEKVNKLISLGLVDRLRRKTARLVGEGVIVDAGCGPGTSTIILREVHPDSTIILLDPSILLLKMASERNKSEKILAVTGRFEMLPFPDNSVDSIVAMFSYRDAVSYSAAASEFARVLKPSGKFAILDFYRPREPWKSIMKAYLAVAVTLAVLIFRCRGKLSMYRGFLRTIDKMLTYDEANNIFRKYFNIFYIKRIVPGLAIFYGGNPKNPSQRAF
jgi:demethylmenaquinone methyltransferase/2-methoxy-6-polyprenyl-1,4-benzoquinol methylase